MNPAVEAERERRYRHRRPPIRFTPEQVQVYYLTRPMGRGFRPMDNKTG